MSWYNYNKENEFIDGTQEFTLGDTTSNITIINNGGGDSTDLGFNSTISDFLQLKFEENVFNLYLQNLNEGGKIFFNNDNTDNKVKIEGGKLFLYYDYDFINAPLIPAGWTDILDYSVATKNQLLGATANIGALDLAVFTPATGLVSRVNVLEPFVASNSAGVIDHEARILVLELFNELEPTDIEFNNALESGLEQLRENMGASSVAFIRMIRNSAYLSGNARNVALAVLRSKQSFYTNLFTSIFQFIGGLTFGLAVVFGIYDRFRSNEIADRESKLIITYEKLKDEANANIDNLIYVNGLLIDPLTNNDFTTTGTYEINIQNGAKLEIKIKIVSGELKAQITEVITTTVGFSINDIITIPKSSLGGSVSGGNLLITVLSLRSEVKMIADELDKLDAEKKGINNNSRRRQAIPNKNDFNNGFSITETTELQESGEELPSIAIDLKIDTAQFEYDNSGNLQLINYSTIGEIGNPSSEGIPATGIFLTTETNTGNITTNTQGITDLETDFTNVYKILMNTGINYDNNTDYKLNIGYKEPFEGYAYNLICYALKTYTADVNNEFGNGRDFLGLYPVLTRLYDNTEIELLEASSLELRSDLSFKKGELTFKNNTTIDLNNNFELVINLKPRNLVLDVEYDILISKELVGNDYTYDNNRLKIFIKNNKLNIRHKAWATYQVGELRLGNNYFLNNFKFNYIIGINTNDSFWITDNLNYYYFTAIENRFGVNYGQDCGIKNNTGNYPIVESDLWSIITTEDGANVPIYLEIAKPNNTSDTTIWDSPTLYYLAGNVLTNGAISSKNFGGVRLRFTYEYWNLLTWINYTVPNQVILDGHNYKLEFGFSTNPNGASTLLLYRNFKTFGSYTGTTLGNYYEETFYFPELAPEITTTLYKKIEIRLVPLIDNTYPGPNSSQKYAGQIRLKLKDFRIYTYYNNALRTITNESIQTITSTDDVFPVDYNPLEFNTLVANIDLPNAITNGVKYYVDDVENTIPPPDTTITVIDNTSYPFTIEKIVNYNFNSITGYNNIFSIGGIPASGEMNYSHFNWKTNTAFLTSEERVKLQELIGYKYYHETVNIDRYLKVKEFYGDIVDFRRVLVNGTTAYESLTPEEQGTRLRTSDQSTGNVLIGNSFLEIGKLFVDNPTISGNLTYDFDTRTFSIAEGASINTEDVENIIDGLIKTTPSTFGLIFNDTDVNDKYLQLDNTYINTLINLVLQNEVSFNTGFTDVKFYDLLIQVKDASIYSPYNLRELVDVNTLYNYVINGSHNYLIRELNQLVQYHPLLGPAFGDYLPTGSFNFNGILAEDQGNTAIDFEVVSAGAQITYGDGYNNNKLQNGLSGGLSYIKNTNLFPFSDSLSGCISCFHKPYGAFTGGNIFEVTDVNEVNLLRLRVGYTSGFARYVLDVFNQTNTNFTQYIFNNSENEVYYENENSILIYYDFPNIYMYVNGFKHDGVITTYTNQTFTNARFKINTSTYNDKSLLYELKVYDRKLFKDNDDIFNFKRVAEITEFYRINPVIGSGLIIKELSGVQETKSRSITNKQTIETLESNTYTDAKVRTVLSASGGNNIVWNTGTNQFDSTVVPYEDSDVETYLQFKGGVGITYNTITQLFDCDITQYSDTNVEGYLQNKGGVGITYNTNTQLFDCDITQYTNTDVEGYIKTKGGVNITYNPTTKKFDNDITQYEDANVETYLSAKGGTGITYNLTTQQFDSDITQYTNTNVETYLKSKGGTGITYNLTTQKFDSDITQYTSTDVRSVLAVSDGNGITWNNITMKFDLTQQFVTLADQYSDADVENLLSVKGGTNIYYNPTTKQFDCSITQFDQLFGSISYATISDPPDLSGFITLGEIPVQYSTSILESDLANKAGTLIDWNATTNQFDVNIPAGTYVIPSDITNFITLGEIPVQYNTTILESDLANKAGNLIDWNGGTNQFDLNLNNTFYDFTVTGKTILNQVVVLQNQTLQFGQTTNPVQINMLDGFIPNVNILEFLNVELFAVRNRNGDFIFYVSDSNDVILSGRIVFSGGINGGGGIVFNDNSVQTTAPVQSDFNETDTNSLAYIANLPNILTKIASTIGGNNIYQSDINHIFRNSLGETSFAIYNNKSARVFGSVLLSDGTTLTTAPVQSDWNENNISSLKYINNKPDLTNFITLGDIPVQYNTTILESDLANKAGNLIDWNNTSKQFDLNLNNTYYNFAISGKTVLNQLVVLQNQVLQFGQTSNPVQINMLDGYITNVNILEITKTEYFTVRKRDGSYLLSIDNLYNTRIGGRLILNNFGTDTGIQFNDGSLQETAPVQSNWNETDTSSLAYINNKPVIPDTATFANTHPTGTMLRTSEGRDRIYYTANGQTSLYQVTYINSSTSQTLTLASGGINKMYITSGSYVDIVATGNNPGTGSKSYWGYTSTPVGNYTGTYQFPVSLSTSQGIWIRQYYYVTSSDSRIKKEIKELDDLECLNKLLLLKPCKYLHKDSINRGTQETYGFIAQEVEEIMPEAIKTTENHIPNIYKNGKIINGIITIDGDFEYTPIVGDEVKIYDKNDEESLVKIVEVFNDKSFRINEDNAIKTEDIFLYGSKVDDFKTLIKEMFHPLAISAIQEHNRIIEAQKNKIIELETTIANIMARLDSAGI